MLFNVYLISKGKTGRGKAQQLFLETTNERAKLYFEAYILENEIPTEYKLYKIGELKENFRIIENYYFICGGYEVKNKKDRIKQQQLELIRSIEIEKEIERNINDLTNEEIIIKLFEGKKIND